MERTATQGRNEMKCRDIQTSHAGQTKDKQVATLCIMCRDEFVCTETKLTENKISLSLNKTLLFYSSLEHFALSSATSSTRVVDLDE